MDVRGCSQDIKACHLRMFLGQMAMCYYYVRRGRLRCDMGLTFLWFAQVFFFFFFLDLLLAGL